MTLFQILTLTQTLILNYNWEPTKSNNLKRPMPGALIGKKITLSGRETSVIS